MTKAATAVAGRTEMQCTDMVDDITPKEEESRLRPDDLAGVGRLTTDELAALGRVFGERVSVSWAEAGWRVVTELRAAYERGKADGPRL